MLLPVACGGGNQITDVSTPEAEVVAKVDVEPSRTKAPPEPEPTESPSPTRMTP